MAHFYRKEREFTEAELDADRRRYVKLRGVRMSRRRFVFASLTWAVLAVTIGIVMGKSPSMPVGEHAPLGWLLLGIPVITASLIVRSGRRSEPILSHAFETAFVCSVGYVFALLVVQALVGGPVMLLFWSTMLIITVGPAVFVFGFLVGAAVAVATKVRQEQPGEELITYDQGDGL